jgi:hypothetical protein
MNSMNESALDIKGQEIVDQAYELVGLVELSYREGTAAHVVEKGYSRSCWRWATKPWGTCLRSMGRVTRESG